MAVKVDVRAEAVFDALGNEFGFEPLQFGGGRGVVRRGAVRLERRHPAGGSRRAGKDAGVPRFGQRQFAIFQFRCVHVIGAK